MLPRRLAPATPEEHFSAAMARLSRLEGAARLALSVALPLALAGAALWWGWRALGVLAEDLARLLG